MAPAAHGVEPPGGALAEDDPTALEGRAAAEDRDEPSTDQRDEELELLTPRELEILKLIAEGHNSKEIAAALVLSIKTVETHRANILSKLGMRDRVDLTRYAIRRGLIAP